MDTKTDESITLPAVPSTEPAKDRALLMIDGYRTQLNEQEVKLADTIKTLEENLQKARMVQNDILAQQRLLSHFEQQYKNKA